MRESLRLFLQLIRVSIRSQMIHRASFLMLIAAFFLGTFTEMIGIWVLFARFNTLNGWQLSEVALIYGLVHMGFSVAECAGRGFDTFHKVVKMGDFDRFLLRPCSTFIQVAGRDFQLLRLGRFLQGLLVLCWGYSQLNIPLYSVQTLLIVNAFIGASMLFYGLMVVQATVSFWLIESLELMNIATYGSVECGQYPMSIYAEGFRTFFTVIIPIGSVAYLPVASLLSKEGFSLTTGLIAPITGIIFFYFSTRFWAFGVKHYRSTGN